MEYVDFDWNKWAVEGQKKMDAEEQGLRLKEKEQIETLAQLEAKLNSALEELDWDTIWATEKQINEIKISNHQIETDRTRIMTEEQKIRYSWLTGADRKKLKELQGFIGILDHARYIMSQQPNDPQQIENAGRYVMSMAKKKGCSQHTLMHFQPCINAMVKAELKSRSLK